MSQLLDSLVQLFWSLWDVLVSLGGVILPWTPLILFVAFWLLAVNWNQLWDVLMGGAGIIGLAFIGLLAVLVWGVVAPPEGGTHSILGLSVGNFTGKLFYVGSLISIMFFCGAAQLAGTVDNFLVFRKSSDDQGE